MSLRVPPLGAAPGALRRDPVAAFAWAAAIVAAVLAVHGATLATMASTWSASDTYAHGFIVLPVVIGWCWLRRAELAALDTRASWAAMALLAVLGAGWWMVDAVGANAPGQYIVITMVPAAVAAVLGMAWVRALALPLAFLFFAVPAGDALIPVLTEWTADFVVASLQLVGIPVYREADNLLIPSGHWTVKESCSGIRYLMACATLGTLYAAMTYRSPLRRLAFVACMVAFAVIANWVRAFGIVMLAHLTDNRLALGVDHLVYGWIFFGLILLVAFGLGRLWREDEAAAQPAAPAADRPRSGSAPAPAALMAGALVLLAWPTLAWLAPQPSGGPAPSAWRLEPAAGWTVRAGSPVAWRPLVAHAAREQVLSFEKAGERVWLHAAQYRGSSRPAKATSSANRLLPADSRESSVIGSEAMRLTLAGQDHEVRSVTIAAAGERLVVVPLFWVDGVLTSSRLRATMEEMLVRLQGRRSRSAWLLLVTDAGPGSDAALARFAREMGPALDRALQAP